MSSTDKRLRTYGFKPLGVDAGSVTVKVSAVYFVERDDDSRIGEVTTVNGGWELSFEWDGDLGESVVADIEEARSLGPGRMVVERVVRSATGVSVEGRLEGWNPAMIPALRLNATLSADGQDLAPELARFGFGEQRERFEFWFTPTADGGSAATFSVVVAEDPVPDGVNTEPLADHVGDRAVFTIELPNATP
jgi:hypothetical protein